jgi:hypothetical protein
MKGWHFVGDTLRGGRPIPADGEVLRHNGPLTMCESGLHFAPTPWDALQYAPGGTLCYVEAGGKIAHDNDKAICSERTIIARRDVTLLCRRFACDQALSVAHLWEMPTVAREYLTTMDESIRDAAWAAAWAAARAAALDATRAATRAAAWAAALDATRAAARDAAWGAAFDAARAEFNRRVYAEFGI